MMIHSVGWGHSCGLGISCASATVESGARIWCKWGAFGPPMAWAADRSGAVVLLLLLAFYLSYSHCGSL